MPQPVSSLGHIFNSASCSTLTGHRQCRLQCRSMVHIQSAMPSQIGCLPYFYTWCGLSANLECRSEMFCTQLAGNKERKKSPFWHHCTTLSGCIFVSSFSTQYEFYAAVQIQTTIKTESASFSRTNVAWTYAVIFRVRVPR